MADLVISNLIFCPRCDYPLEGLPLNHQCPECGIDYDENCKAYISDFKPKDKIFNKYISPLVLILIWLVSCILVNPFSPTASVLNYVAVTAITLFYIGIYRFIRNKESSPDKPIYVIATTTDGIWEYRSGFNRRMIAWDNIEYFQVGHEPLTNRFDELVIARKKQDDIIHIYFQPTGIIQRDFLVQDAHRRIPTSNVKEPVRNIRYCIRCFADMGEVTEVMPCHNCRLLYDLRSRLYRIYPRNIIHTRLRYLAQNSLIIFLVGGVITGFKTLYALLSIPFVLLLYYLYLKLKHDTHMRKANKRDFTFGVCVDGMAFWDENGRHHFEYWVDIMEMNLVGGKIEIQIHRRHEKTTINSIPIDKETGESFIAYIKNNFRVKF